MGQYDFTHEFPNDFKMNLCKFLQQNGNELLAKNIKPELFIET